MGNRWRESSLSIKLDIEKVRKVAKDVHRKEIMDSWTFPLTIILLLVSLASAPLIIILSQTPPYIKQISIFFAAIVSGFLLERCREYRSALKNYGLKLPDAVEKILLEAELDDDKLQQCKVTINTYRVQLQENEDKSLKNILTTLQTIVEGG